MSHQRLLPQHVDAEKGLLSSLMIASRETAAELMTQVSNSSFHIPAHAMIFDGITKLYNSGSALDFITLTEAMQKDGTLNQAGGAAGITELFTFVPTSVNALYYAEILQEKETLRQIIAAGTEFANRSYDYQEEVLTLLDEFEQRVFKIAQYRHKNTREKSIKDHVMDCLEQMEKVQDGKQSGAILTGIRAFDNKTGGMFNGEVTVLTGGTGGGKTAYGHQILSHVALEQKKAAMIFSYEMPARVITLRSMCNVARVDTENARTGRLVESDYPKISQAAARLTESKIFIEDNQDCDLSSIRAKARRRKASDDISLVVIDYIQKIPTTGKRSNSRQRDVAEVSDSIQKMSMELDIPVLVLSQENDDGQTREAKDIAFDAKTVLKIRRPDDSVPVEEEGISAKRDLIICKNNNGSLGTVHLTFLKWCVRFEECYHDKKQDARYGE